MCLSAFHIKHSSLKNHYKFLPLELNSLWCKPTTSMGKLQAFRWKMSSQLPCNGSCAIKCTLLCSEMNVTELAFAEKKGLVNHTEINLLSVKDSCLSQCKVAPCEASNAFVLAGLLIQVRTDGELGLLLLNLAAQSERRGAWNGKDKIVLFQRGGKSFWRAGLSQLASWKQSHWMSFIWCEQIPPTAALERQMEKP